DFWMEDHRALPRLAMDLRLAGETVDLLQTSGYEFGMEILATRGETMLLGRFVLANQTERIEMLLPVEERDGMLVWGALYDEDELDAALDAVDRRFAEGEGAEHAAVLGSLQRATAA